jgi:membrane glycosyltransferase
VLRKDAETMTVISKLRSTGFGTRPCGRRRFELFPVLAVMVVALSQIEGILEMAGKDVLSLVTGLLALLVVSFLTTMAFGLL